MSRMSRIFPSPRLRQCDRVAVAASPDEAYAAFWRFDASRIPWIDALFRARTLPHRLRSRSAERRPIGLEGVLTPGSGFFLIEDAPGEEIVVGSVGHYWSLDMDYADVEAADFTSFAEPGWGKIAWSVRAEPREGGGSILTFELAVGATDEESWQKFRRYFLVIGRFSHAIRRTFLKEMERELGSVTTVPLAHRPLPGDDLLDDVRAELTHAVEIDAPASAVWPYLVQMGGKRAGWYSWDLVDHGNVPREDQVVEPLQHLKVGDVVATLPLSDEGFEVLRLEPERLLLLGGALDRRTHQRLPLEGGSSSETPFAFKMTWAFVLEPLGADACRLITRVRMKARPPWAEALQARVLAPLLHGVMGHKQLRGIRERAERAAHPSS